MNTIESINEAVNDLLVARLEIQQLEDEYLAIVSAHPRLAEIQQQIDIMKESKGLLQERVIETMRENQLKSWKTEQANFARAVRRSVNVDPAYKSVIEKRLKAGEQVEGWELKETEYLSIRTNKL